MADEKYNLSSAPEYRHLLEELKTDKKDILAELFDLKLSDTDGVIARHTRDIVRRYKAIKHIEEKMKKFIG